MYFDSIAAVIDMNGHGLYVWLAYAITVTLLFWLLWAPLRQLRVRRLWVIAEGHRRAVSDEPQSESAHQRGEADKTFSDSSETQG